MLMSCSPANDSLFSFPNSAKYQPACPYMCRIQRQPSRLVLTISCIYSWLCTSCFSEHNRCMWIVFLHRRICSCKERSASNISYCSSSINSVRVLRKAALKKSHETSAEQKPHLVAPLCSPVWQNKNRTSFSVCENAYLPDILTVFRKAWRFNCVCDIAQQSMKLLLSFMHKYA
jgi:hypothetical protein